MYNELCLKLDNIYLLGKAKAENFFSSEKGEVNIVATVLLIGVACLLAVAFRKQIQDLLNTLFQAINKKANEAIQ